MAGKAITPIRQVKVFSETLGVAQADILCADVHVIDEIVSDGATDEEKLIAIDVSALKGLYLLSDKNITIEINDGAGAGGTIALVAGIPVQWYEGDPAAAKPLATDVTGFYMTNAAGADAHLQGYIGYGSPA